MTEDDKAAAAKAYYSHYGIKPGDSIVAEYEPANEFGYRWRQFIAGFGDSPKAVSARLDHYQDHPGEIPGAVAGAIYDGVAHTATNAAGYATSDVPGWTLTQQHDQYGVPSGYNLGVGANKPH